jgi:hypothetical protein
MMFLTRYILLNIAWFAKKIDTATITTLDVELVYYS